MQANKQYSSNGVQNAMYPNPVMNITQTIDGYYSHRGTNAIDDAQEDTGRSNGYAPCDMVCVATDYGEAYGNAMFWQSTAPVNTRSHGQQYITMMVIHDSTADAYVGLTVSQGQQLFSEGTAGNATGNHNHIEVALGQWTGTHYVESGGLTAWGSTVYMLPGNINPAEVFFVDDTQILNGGGLDWATTGGSSATSSFSTDQLIEEHALATFTVDQLNARVNGPTSNWICRQYNTGDTVEYHYKWVGNGHRYICWYEAENLIMVAVSAGEDYNSERWATFSEIQNNDTSQSDNQPDQQAPGDTVDTSNVKHWGVDISEHNSSDLDLSKYDFAIIRATWGTNTDKKLDEFVKKADEAGIPYGLYCYSYTIDNASSQEEIDYFLDVAKNYNPKLGVWFDMEDADEYKKKMEVLDREHCLNFCQRFCKAMKEAGYYTGVYSSTWWFDNWLNEGLDDYDKWVAQWDSNDGDYHSDLSAFGSIHQYTSIDKSSGANIDKNAMYVDFDHYILDSQNTKPKDDTKSDTKNDNSDLKETNNLLKMLIELLKKIFHIES